MNGRFVWIEPDDGIMQILKKREAAPADPVAAFIEAVRDRLGDAEHATETIALGLRALGRPYPLADQREKLW